MCLIKDSAEPICKPKSPPRSPWHRLMRKNIKAKLNRKVVSGAKVNLNNFWSEFAGLSKSRQPVMILHSTSISDNEINDNLLNELTELAQLGK